MNILLVRLSSFGDIVLTTPVIKALRRRYPDASLDFALYDRFNAALSEHPEIDRLLVLPKKKLKQLLGQRRYLAFLRELIGFVSELRRKKYDQVIDLHNVTESALVALLARGGVKTGNRRQLLTLLFDKRLAIDDGFSTAKSHVAYTNLSYLQAAGLLGESDLPAAPRLEFFLPAAAVAEVDAYLREHGLEGKRLAGVNPCASYDFKRWNEAGFAAVADHLAESGYTVLIFGSPGEQAIVQRVIDGMKQKALDTSHLTLFQAFELIRRLKLFVTNDSAPMHIASAFDTPLVAIHGPINVRKFGPLSGHAVSLTRELPCLPCKSSRDCADRTCFDSVTAEEVSAACDRLLSSQPEAGTVASL